MADNNTVPGNQNSQNNNKPTLSWSQPAASKPVVTPSPTATVPSVKTTTTTTATTTASANTSNTGTYVGIFVAGLIVGALIGWGITSSKTDGTVATTASSTTMTATSTTGSTNTTGTTGGVNLTGSTIGSSANVTLAATQQAGFAVAVSNAVVSQPTWLVVYENHNGTPGNAIGAGLFFPGNTSGTIQLLRATLPGQSYFVGQSLDDGDKVFSLQNDKPVRDAQGNPLFTAFTAQ